jgi:ubiquinone/menaquinone biosynthesis C-methylase UbiE
MTFSRFDNAAATWDEQPGRIVLTRHIAQAILTQVPASPSMAAVDYGCGTGLLTLALQSSVGRIIGADSSPGMLAKLQEKIQSAGAVNVQTRLLDLETQPPPDDVTPDLIVSAMTLHHIVDLAKLLRAFHQWLNPGGYLALADLDTEDGSFHQDAAGVHRFGVDRDWLAAQFAALDLREVRVSTAHVIERPDAAGNLKRYPVFLISAHKAG